MATWLSLTKDLARESGTLAGGPASIVTVVGATGRLEKLAGWVRDAWVNIQNDRPNWPWMLKEFSAPLTIGQARYSRSDFGIDDRFGRWVDDRPDFRVASLYDPAIGKSDESAILQRDYDEWRRRYARSTHDANRPTDWAISRERELCFGATPDKAYMLSSEYRVSPQVFTADDDVPELPDEFHGAIVWEAMKLRAIADGDQLGQINGTTEFLLAREALYRDDLDEVTFSFNGGGYFA